MYTFTWMKIIIHELELEVMCLYKYDIANTTSMNVSLKNSVVIRNSRKILPKPYFSFITTICDLFPSSTTVRAIVLPIMQYMYAGE